MDAISERYRTWSKDIGLRDERKSSTNQLLIYAGKPLFLS